LLVGRTSGVPDVLADADAKKILAQLKDWYVLAPAEVVILVEGTVVGQMLLVVAVQNLAARDDGAGVVEVPVKVHEPDSHRDSFRHLCGKFPQGVEVIPDKARLK